MNWLRENWFWVVIFMFWFWMHSKMHAGHSGHSGQRRHGGTQDPRPSGDPDNGNKGHHHAQH